MRPLLIALLVAWASVAQALPCVLTDADYAAIAQASMHYNKQAIAALSQRDQRELCRARLLLRFAKGKTTKQIVQNCTAGDLPRGFGRFITSAEYNSLIKGALPEIMADAAADRTNGKWAPKCTAKLGPYLR